MRVNLSDRRAVFEYVANHMWWQGWSVDNEEGPRYRLSDGTPSVLGCLLTDEEAAIGDGLQPNGKMKKGKRLSLEKLIERVPSVAEKLNDFHINLLYTMRDIRNNRYPSNALGLLDEVWNFYRNRYEGWKPVVLRNEQGIEHVLNGSHIRGLNEWRQRMSGSSSRGCTCNGTGADGCW